jgi:23S rRNA pseudouridine2604 synthase
MSERGRSPGAKGTAFPFAQRPQRNGPKQQAGGPKAPFDAPKVERVKPLWGPGSASSASKRAPVQKAAPSEVKRPQSANPPSEAESAPAVKVAPAEPARPAKREATSAPQAQGGVDRAQEAKAAAPAADPVPAKKLAPTGRRILSVKPAAPPVVEVPRVDSPRSDAARAKGGQRSEGPRTDKARPNARADAPRTDRPRADAPRTGKPRTEAPRVSGEPGATAPKTAPVDAKPASTGKPRGAVAPWFTPEPPKRRPAGGGDLQKTAAAAAARAPTHDAAEGPVRVSKLMAERGLCSRREADTYIERGWVFVNGERITELGTRALPDAKIKLAPEAQTQQERQATILLNKPIGYVSGQPEPGFEPAVVLIRPDTQHRSKDGDDTAFEPRILKGLAPAGRLDIDSTGLLVLTQDGRIARLLIGEDSQVEKEYLVRVEGQLIENGLALLNHGLSLDGKALKPAKVEWLNDDQLRFVLKEGKKRQIRRMCELVGLKVVGLKRVRIGELRLGDLPLGKWRYLKASESF